ncbi:MAG: putative sulfate exporter family transporter, partial [Alistipes sp.]
SIFSMVVFRRKGAKIQIPWFIGWFILAMIVNTYIALPEVVTHSISRLARGGLSATLFLIGGGLSIEVIRRVGLRPLVLGVVLWATISLLSLTVILVK